MRRLSWGLCACVAVLLAVAPGAVAAPAPDPTCDFPAQATATYRPTGDESPARLKSGAARATVCEHTTGAQGMEPMLAVNRRGTLFMGIATDKGLYEEPGRLNGTARELPAAQPRRRPHLAAHPPAGRHRRLGGLSLHRSRDGPPVRHVVLGRRRRAAASRSSTATTRGRPGPSPRRARDARRRLTATGRRSSAARSRARRRAAIRPPSTSATSSPTSSSPRRSAAGDPMTAATTSSSPGFLPTVNGLCRAGDVQGGTGATIVHGSGRVLSNGDVVVPLTVCGRPAVVRSTDEGKTWTADRHRGTEPRAGGRRRRPRGPRARGSPITSGRRTSPSTTTTTCTSPTSATGCT